MNTTGVGRPTNLQGSTAPDASLFVSDTCEEVKTVLRARPVVFEPASVSESSESGCTNSCQLSIAMPVQSEPRLPHTCTPHPTSGQPQSSSLLCQAPTRCPSAGAPPGRSSTANRKRTGQTSGHAACMANAGNVLFTHSMSCHAVSSTPQRSEPLVTHEGSGVMILAWFSVDHAIHPSRCPATQGPCCPRNRERSWTSDGTSPSTQGGCGGCMSCEHR